MDEIDARRLGKILGSKLSFYSTQSENHPFWKSLNEKQVAQIAEHIPSGSFGAPDDIAAAAVFLASNEARYITGQTIHVNGGMVMI